MMKKRDILLAVGIIAVALLAVLFVSQRTGLVRIANPGVELELRGGLARHVTLRSSPKPREIRAGNYRPTHLTITQKQDGQTWELQSRGPWGQLGRIAVAGEQATTIDVGPPLQVKPEVTRMPGRVFVGLSIYGQAGEKYRNTILRNGRRASAPKVRIVDKTGKVLASGAFRYG
ncbi:MAG: hypothetical protein JW741_27895 [Sedimentisphaerales bacterium]|nr:hypothetical protein [Sedimentisphaerales bacterium]